MIKNSQGNIAIAIVTLVLGLAVGGGIGYASNNGGGDDSMDKESTATSQSSSLGDDGTTVGGAKMVRTLDIVDNAANASNVTTVVSLVQQAGLVDTLKSEGPFTVFGPNNDAFAAVPADILEKVAGNNDILTAVLTYHVIPGTYTTADFRALANSGGSLKTVQGAELSFKVVDGDVVVVDSQKNEVQIETPDIISSNGVTHVIKNVLLPIDPTTL